MDLVALCLSQLTKNSALFFVRFESPRFDENSLWKIMLQRLNRAMGVDSLCDEAA